MKVLIALLAVLLLVSCEEMDLSVENHDCPHDLEVRCIDDINKAYPICEKAAKEKGADIPVDLECMKYFVQMEHDCFPCICWVAEQEHWHIKGC